MKAVLMAARASQVEGAGEIRTLAHQITRSWIRSEVEDPAQAALMRFLLRISVPEVLPPGLPEHLDNGNGTTAQQLTMLEEKGIISIDPTTLVAVIDALSLPHVRAEASARITEELPALHALTAQWELGDGDPLRALRHAVAAGDYPLVTAVISRHWMHFLWSGVIRESQTVLEQIPRRTLREYPVITGILGLAANMNPAMRSRALGYLRLSISGARAQRRGVERPQRLFLDVLESSFLRISGEPEGLLLRARSAASMLDEWSTDLAARPSEILFRTQLAISFFRMGLQGEALEILEDVLAAPADSPALGLHQGIAIKSGILAHAGAITESRKLLRRAQRMSWPRGLRDTYLGAMYHYASALDRVEAFDLEGARHHIETISPQAVNIEFWPYIAAVRAYVQVLRGEALTAYALL